MDTMNFTYVIKSSIILDFNYLSCIVYICNFIGLPDLNFGKNAF